MPGKFTRILVLAGIFLIIFPLIFFFDSLLVKKIIIVVGSIGIPLLWFTFCYFELCALIKQKKNPIDFIVKSSIILAVISIILELSYIGTCSGEQCLGTLYAPFLFILAIVINIGIQYAIIKVISMIHPQSKHPNETILK
ncbi:TPA: hypothetical protein DF272_00770 [Candidatus Falkowbacteria bacterium]|nr:hypothetical protein [Candidatus Falkowbacteria bacterium]